jgi:hypothetical protein
MTRLQSIVAWSRSEPGWSGPVLVRRSWLDADVAEITGGCSSASLRAGPAIQRSPRRATAKCRLVS